MVPTSPTPNSQALRRTWLKQVAGEDGGRGRGAAALLVLDGVAAIGFAAGLAGGLVSIPQGLDAALPWLALAVAAAAARGGCALGCARLGAAASATVRTAVRRRVVVACLGLPPGERPPVGEMLTTAVDAVEALDGYVARFLPARRAAGAVPLLVLAAAAFASPVSAGILLATFIPFVAVMALAGGAAADQSRQQLSALGRLSGLFADRVRALPLVLAFQAEQSEAERLGRLADELRRRTMSVLRVAFVSSAGLEFFAALSVALVAVYAGFTLLHMLPFPAPERLGFGQAFFVLALAPEFYAPMRRLAAAYHDRQAAETAADRLLALPAGPLAPRPPAVFTVPPAIRFDAVSVRYPGEAHASLDEFSFTAAPGEIVALLGPSGSGKTTALNLLLGLAPLAGGEVWIDGRALTEIGSVAASVSWVGQTPVIVPGSLAENIALSRQDATPAQIARAAERAGLCGVLARPGGLAARVDERGGGLSGGERRRVALARALLKPAPILLLDEPTAHLDAASEAALIPAIAAAARGRTTIIATHSMALAAIADRVVRLA